MSKEIHFCHPEFALFKLGIQLVFLSTLEHLAEVLHMLLQGVTIEQNVIYADNYKVIEPFPENVIHESAKCGGHIGEPEGHHQELI
jgi:hypothetical protein